MKKIILEDVAFVLLKMSTHSFKSLSLAIDFISSLFYVCCEWHFTCLTFVVIGTWLLNACSKKVFMSCIDLVMRWKDRISSYHRLRKRRKQVKLLHFNGNKEETSRRNQSMYFVTLSSSRSWKGTHPNWKTLPYFC